MITFKFKESLITKAKKLFLYFIYPKYVVDAINRLKKNRILNLGLVLNQSAPDSVDVLFGTPIIAKIPFDRTIARHALHAKSPVLNPKSGFSKSALTLGKTLII